MVAEDAEAARLGAVPAYMFLTWECLKAAAAGLRHSAGRPRTAGPVVRAVRGSATSSSSRAVNGSGPKRAAASTARSAM